MPWNKDRPTPRTRCRKLGCKSGSQAFFLVAGTFSGRRHFFWSQAFFLVAGAFLIVGGWKGGGRVWAGALGGSELGMCFVATELWMRRLIMEPR